MFDPVPRQSLSQSVYEQLRDGIVRGELASGTRLPSERELAERLNVNRGAVREAFKRLEQARLVSIRQGGAARVLDYTATAGLDLLSELLFAGGSLDIGLARSVVEMRACLGPEIAGRCAERASDGVRDRLQGILSSLCDTEDLAERQTLSLEYWDALVEGSQNLAYRLSYNSLRLSYDSFREVLVEVLAPELKNLDGFRGVVQAVLERDSLEARVRAANHLEQGAEALYLLLDSLALMQGGDDD